VTAVELTAADGHRLSAHLAEPADPAPRAGVVVVQEIFGVNAHIREVTDRFAQAGLVAVAPSLFDRVERGVELAYDEHGVTRGRDLAWETVPIDDALADLAAAADHLAARVGGPEQVAVVGFCYGGMLAAASAARLPHHLGAAVAYYPSMAAQLLTDDRVTIPLLLHLGDRDQRVTVADGQALAERWPGAEVYRYDADHGFNCDHRPGFDAHAAAAAWERTLTFLDHHLGRGRDAG
jgi:carboxymethylenebutenolidase